MNNKTESTTPSRNMSGSDQCGNTAVDVSFLVVYTIQALAIFVGNLLTSVVFLSKRQLRNSFMNIFLVSLAIADFLVSLLVFPGHTVLCENCLASQFSRTDTVCIVFDGIKDYVLLTTVFNILAITFDRYVAVLQPLKYTLKITKKSVAIILFCTWSVPWPLSFMKQIIVSIKPTMFKRKSNEYIYDNVVVFACIIAPMFLIAVVNGMITKAIKVQVSKISYQGNQYVNEPRQDEIQGNDAVGCHGDQGSVEEHGQGTEKNNSEIKRRKSFVDGTLKEFQDDCHQPRNNRFINNNENYDSQSLSNVQCVIESAVNGASTSELCVATVSRDHVTTLSRDAMMSHNDISLHAIDTNSDEQIANGAQGTLENVIENIETELNKVVVTQDKCKLNGRDKHVKKFNIKSQKRKRKYGLDLSAGFMNEGFTIYEERKPDITSDKRPGERDNGTLQCISKNYVNNSSVKGPNKAAMITKRLRKISRDLRERNGTRSCLVIVMIFIVCWVPRCLLNVFRLFAPPDFVNIYLLEQISVLFLFFQSLINPVVYSFYRTDFRQATRDLIRKGIT